MTEKIEITTESGDIDLFMEYEEQVRKIIAIVSNNIIPNIKKLELNFSTLNSNLSEGQKFENLIPLTQIEMPYWSA